MRIAVTGATGFIGRALCAQLQSDGAEVVRLVRRPTGKGNELAWSAEEGLREPHKLEGCEAVVHLAGESIAGGLRWTAEKKARIMQSRVQGTRNLIANLARLRTPPRAFLCASAIGIYGDRGEEILTEASPIGSRGFLVEVARAWEEAAAQAKVFAERVVHLRIGLVLGLEGGALPQMLPLFKWGLGGPLGSGRQWWSWISLEDVVGGITHALQHPEIVGAVNFTAPTPVTNSEFTRTLAQALRRPACLPAPAFALKLLMGEMAEELLLASTRVLPQQLQSSGYAFKHSSLRECLSALLAH